MYGVAGWARKASFAVLGVVVAALLFVGYSYRRSQSTEEPWTLNIPQQTQHGPVDGHPVSNLIYEAGLEFIASSTHLSTSYANVVSRYRERYGRHPPPNFCHWYQFARTRNVYDLDAFDQIHQDLRPFWAIRPANLRYWAAHSADDRGHRLAVLSIRDGQFIAPKDGRHIESVMSMIKGFVEWLPDMDVPVNKMDEPRILPTYEDVQGWHKVEELSRKLLPFELLQQNFTKSMRGLRNGEPIPRKQSSKSTWSPFWYPSEYGEDPIALPPTYTWKEYVAWPLWKIATRGCAGDLPLRKLKPAESTRQQPGLDVSFVNPGHPLDICSFTPEDAVLHASLASPSEMMVTPVLFPVFSQSKMSVNSDILIPSSEAYFNYEGIFRRDRDAVRWEHKHEKLFWRGDTSGGWSFDEDDKEDPRAHWRQWQKQRLVSLTNASEESQSSILSLSAGSEPYSTFPFNPERLISAYVDTGFTAFSDCKQDKCDFYGDVFSLMRSVSLRDWWKNKFVLDLDGRGGSSLLWTFLQSRSVPFTSTIFLDWTTARLTPWYHFVPLSHTYTELWSLLTYFTGYRDGELRVLRHDVEAAKIAQQGQQWARRVLRKEDMEVYMFRLLLEYGRIIDDRRERLGELLEDEGTIFHSLKSSQREHGLLRRRPILLRPGHGCHQRPQWRYELEAEAQEKAELEFESSKEPDKDGSATKGHIEDEIYYSLLGYDCSNVEVVRDYMNKKRCLIKLIQKYQRQLRYRGSRSEAAFHLVLIIACGMTLGCTIPDRYLTLLQRAFKLACEEELPWDDEAERQVESALNKDHGYKNDGTPYEFCSEDLTKNVMDKAPGKENDKSEQAVEDAQATL